RCLGSSSGLYGFVVVMSSLTIVVRYRSVWVVGLYVLIAIIQLLEVLCVLRHLLAGFQPHIRLLPIGTVAGKLAPAAFLAREVGSAYRIHFHFEDGLHSFFNLCLRRGGRHLENERALRLLYCETFFRDHRTANDLIMRFHYATSAAFS